MLFHEPRLFCITDHHPLLGPYGVKKHNRAWKLTFLLVNITRFLSLLAYLVLFRTVAFLNLGDMCVLRWAFFSLHLGSLFFKSPSAQARTRDGNLAHLPEDPRWVWMHACILVSCEYFPSVPTPRSCTVSLARVSCKKIY